jgi:UDP-N-acetylglucosamine 2-epimerase (non-hydrolysing)
MATINPDAMIVLGDTNSSLSVIAAKRRKIPIFHMEAGNRCFDLRVPEEINRKIVDHTSDINIVFSEHARRYMIAEGIRPETIIKTGSPMKEVLDYYMPGIESSNVISRLELKPSAYLVVSAHREENIDSERNFSDLLASFNAIASRYDMPVIVSTHPRTRNRMESLNVTGLDPRIHFLKPLGFFDYVKLQQHAFCVVSDSGTITEESSVIGFPAITIRQAHERPEGMDEATVIMSGLTPDAVLQSIDVATAHYAGDARPFRVLQDYDVKNVSKKVLRIILSYTDYVNRTVWFKS